MRYPGHPQPIDYAGYQQKPINDIGTDMSESLKNQNPMNPNPLAQQYNIPPTAMQQPYMGQAPQPVAFGQALFNPPMNQPFIGNPGFGAPSYQPQPNQVMQPGAPLLIENMNEFYLGPREGLQVQITQPGDLNRGVLDYGIVTGPQGVTFTGFIAAVRHQYQTIP